MHAQERGRRQEGKLVMVWRACRRDFGSYLRRGSFRESEVRQYDAVGEKAGRADFNCREVGMGFTRLRSKDSFFGRSREQRLG